MRGPAAFCPFTSQLFASQLRAVMCDVLRSGAFRVKTMTGRPLMPLPFVGQLFIICPLEELCLSLLCHVWILPFFLFTFNFAF